MDNIKKDTGQEYSAGKKAVKLLLPVISGFLVNFLMVLPCIVTGNSPTGLEHGYKSFLKYYSWFIVIIAFLIQYFIVVPVFCKYIFESKREKFFGFAAIVLFSLISALVFAILDSSPLQLPFEFLSNALYAFILISVYWSVNLHVTDYLCKIKD